MISNYPTLQWFFLVLCHIKPDNPPPRGIIQFSPTLDGNVENLFPPHVHLHERLCTIHRHLGCPSIHPRTSVGPGFPISWSDQNWESLTLGADCFMNTIRAAPVEGKFRAPLLFLESAFSDVEFVKNSGPWRHWTVANAPRDLLLEWHLSTSMQKRKLEQREKIRASTVPS